MNTPDLLLLHIELDSKDLIAAQKNVLKQYGKVTDSLLRDIIVPADMTLHAIHYAIQKLFGWQNSHLHNFSLQSKIFKKGRSAKEKNML